MTPAVTKPNRDVMSLIMLIADSISLLACSAIAVMIRHYFNGKFHPSMYLELTPALLIFYLIFYISKLYPGVLISPPDELKRLSQATTLGFLIFSAIVFLSKDSQRYSRGIFLMAWSMSLFTVPIMRFMLRRVSRRFGLWGRGTIIFGAGKTGSIVAKTLNKYPLLGLTPIAFLDDDTDKRGTFVHGVPVIGPFEMASELAKSSPSRIAVLACPGIDRSRLQAIVDKHTSFFHRVLLIPDLFGITSLWVSTADIGGILGLDIRHKLLDPKRQLVKRVLELGLIISTLPLSLPLIGLISVAVRMGSPGPIFFKHKRIGFGGRDITIWKFRTMIQDAEERLQECLKDPEMFSCWNQQQKIPNDPRITRLGRFLRATSLDELPQLLNVVRGDLSLVGPRPIVWAEAKKYEAGFELYKKVRPGVTGLWQVSGRSSTSYKFRVNLDTYYVRNWSVWMDIYILAKTPLAVLSRKGAY